MKKAITVKQAAEISGYSPHWVRVLCQTQKIVAQHVRVGHRKYLWRIDKESLERYVTEMVSLGKR